MAFKVDAAVNTECKKDFDLFNLHLKNQSTWAVKMMESSEWPLVGILSGKVDHMGNYDECLAISSYGIGGRYCLAKVEYHYSDTAARSELVQEPDKRNSVWNTVNIYEKNPGRVNRKSLQFALCLPSSCTPADLNMSLNGVLLPIFKNNGLDLTVDVDPVFCRTQNDSVYSPGYYIVKWLFLIFFSFVICCTLCDAAVSGVTEVKYSDEQERHFFEDVLRIFSLRRNFRKLTQCTSKDDTATHFTKVLNMMCILYGHRIFYTFSFPAFESTVKEQFYNGIELLLTHGNAVVDPFFFCSGLLTFRSEFQPMKKGGKYFLFSNILLRWIRMVPVFAILMLYIIYILPYSGDGPLWNYKVMSEVNKCMESWWASLFAINNVVKINQQCLIASWYISVDIQLAIIGGILLYIFSRNAKLGILAVAVLFITSIAMTFIYAYVNQFHGLLRYYLNTLQDLRADNEFLLYSATFPRCGPYLMGFMAAYAVQLLNENKIKFTNNQIHVFSLLAFLIVEASSSYGYSYYVINRPYYRFENALHAALNHVIFMGLYVVLTCFYFTSGLGIFTKMLEWKIWIPFGRLTYSVFLINTVILLYHVSSQRQPFSLPNRMNLVWWLLGDMMWCYLIGLFVYLFFEAPILNIRVLIKKQLSKMSMKSNPEKYIAEIDLKTPANQ
ncbi:O-acyltransferase like protein-like isoform X2 [Planococcus citri]